MVSIHLDDAVAAALSAQASAEGVSVEEFLRTILLSPPPQSSSRLPWEEVERLLDNEATLGHSPPGTFSREEIYSDHD